MPPVAQPKLWRDEAKHRKRSNIAIANPLEKGVKKWLAKQEDC